MNAPEHIAVTDAVGTMANQWSARLNVSFEAGPERTTVRRNHTGPLAIQRPYYPEGKTAHVYLLHPPGGVVAQDHLQINVTCEEAAHGLVSTPGATRYYRSDGGLAHTVQTIECEGGALEWFPQENIFFSGCHARLKTSLSVSSTSRLAWWEINCFGRPHGKVPFENGSVENIMELSINASLVLKDRLIVNDEHPISATCGLRDCSVVGTLVFTQVHPATVESARSAVMDKAGFSATTFDNVLIVRYLGDSSEDAKAGFIKVWSVLRCALNGKTSMAPRIWAT